MRVRLKGWELSLCCLGGGEIGGTDRAAIRPAGDYVADVDAERGVLAAYEERAGK